MITVYKVEMDGSLSHREELNNMQEVEEHCNKIKTLYNHIKIVGKNETYFIQNPERQFIPYKKNGVLL